MTTDRDALLAAILEAPEDDTLRLIFADCIEELGQGERAEFIRLQIELAKPFECKIPTKKYKDCFGFNKNIPEFRTILWCTECEKLRNLRLREKELQPIEFTHHATWKRGFVETITCPLQSWLESGESIVREHPIQKVVCTDKEPYPSVNRPGVFFWLRADFSGLETMGDHIPDEIFHYLETKYQHPNQQQQVIIVNSKDAKYYPSQQAAIDDLSQALIRWAKSQSAKQSVSRTC